MKNLEETFPILSGYKIYKNEVTLIFEDSPLIEEGHYIAPMRNKRYKVKVLEVKGNDIKIDATWGVVEAMDGVGFIETEEKLQFPVGYLKYGDYWIILGKAAN